MTHICSKPILIGPSILNADLSQLAVVCDNLLNSGADYLHLDIMDGHFVPNITIGHPVVASLKKHLPCKAFLDLHMMVSDPEKWVENMKAAGASQYTFHFESSKDVMHCIQKIREADMKVGLGIKPKTPVTEVLPYVDLVDMVLIMTVEPGFGGQKFMADMLPKVRYLREKYTNLDIEVDGGVTLKNIRDCVEFIFYTWKMLVISLTYYSVEIEIYSNETTGPQFSTVSIDVLGKEKERIFAVLILITRISLD
ncbi:Ribulose-phosphate 3-epimerase isoform 2 [Schistosoma japonicum]|uniref:ribulose-phosphate 3-epimerase n=1 Tax=Schistosoma japonicum TaxID=6182 RepID=A0A4Z2CQB6_SCHJA|nr:Ribulose-phosphate 3-epimerase isoform 2 [Schistosoma japonicum]